MRKKKKKTSHERTMVESVSDALPAKRKDLSI